MSQNTQLRPLRSTPSMPSPKTDFPWRSIFAALFLIIILVCLAFMVWYVQQRTPINVRVAGADASVKTKEELEQVIKNQQKKVKIEFKVEGKTVAPELEEIGVAFATQKTVGAVFSARNDDVFTRLSVWRPVDVQLEILVDKQKLEQYLQADFAGVFTAPIQPDIRYNDRIEEYERIPGQPGRGFSVDRIAAQIEKLAEGPKKITLQPGSAPVQPSITELAATKVQDAATFRTNLRLDVTYQQKTIYFPEPDEIASWQSTRVSGDGTTLEIVYDKKKITETLKTKVTQSLNDFFGPNGSEIDHSQKELVIKNSDAIVNDIILALQNAQSFEKELEVAEKE